MKARSNKEGLVAILILVVFCFFKNMSKISTKASSYEPVLSYVPEGFFALYNKDKVLKPFPSYSDYHKGFNRATVELWQTVRRTCRDGFITLSIKSLHFFVSKFTQFRYSISAANPINGSWTSRIIFWVTFTRSVSSMANDTVL